MADKKVEGPSLAGLQPPARQTPSTKKTTKMVFATEEEAKKFLAESAKARAEAGTQSKVSLKITPQTAPNASTQPKQMNAAALRQTAETRGASRTETTQEAGLRQGGAQATGGIQSKSLPLPAASITKIEKAVLSSAAAKMGGVNIEKLEQHVQDPTFQGEIITAARDLFGGGPVSRWDIMLLLLAMHYKNRDTHDTIHDQTSLLKELKTRADDLQLRIDFVQNNKFAGVRAMQAQIKADLGLVNAQFEWMEKGQNAVRGLIRHDAEGAVRDASARVQQGESEVARFRGPPASDQPPPTAAEKDAAKRRMEAAAQRQPFNATEFNEARNEYARMVGSVVAHRDAAAAQPDTPEGRQRATGERNAAAVDERNAVAAEGRLASARQDLQTASENMIRTFQLYPSEDELKSPGEAGKLRSTMAANTRLAELNNPSGNMVARLDARLGQLRERRAELQQKIADGTITPEEREELSRLDADIGSLSRRRDQAQAAFTESRAAVRQMNSEASRVLGDLDTMKSNGRISDDEYNARIRGLEASSARLGRLLVDPNATPEAIHAAAVEYEGLIRSASRTVEEDRVNASDRNPEQRRAYMAAWDANAGAIERSRIAAIDSRATDSAIAARENELGSVTDRLAGPPAPTGVERTTLEAQATRLRGEITTLRARKVDLTYEAESARIDVQLTGDALEAARLRREDGTFLSAPELTRINRTTGLAQQYQAAVLRRERLELELGGPPAENESDTGTDERSLKVRAWRAADAEVMDLGIRTRASARPGATAEGTTDPAAALSAAAALRTAINDRRVAVAEADRAFNAIPEPRPSRVPLPAAPPASDTSPRANAIRAWLAAEERVAAANARVSTAQASFDTTAAPLATSRPGEPDPTRRPAAAGARKMEEDRVRASGRSPAQVTEYMRAYDANEEATARSRALGEAVSSLDRRLEAQRAELTAVTATLSGTPPPTPAERDALRRRETALRVSIRAGEAEKNRLQIESQRAARDVTTTNEALTVARREYPNATGEAKFTSADSLRRLNAGVATVLTASRDVALAEWAAAERSNRDAAESADLLGPNPGLFVDESGAPRDIDVVRMEADRTRYRDLMARRDDLVATRSRLEQEGEAIDRMPAGAEKDRRRADLDRRIANVNQQILSITPEIVDIGARVGFTPGLSAEDRTARATAMTEREALLRQTPPPADFSTRLAAIDGRINAIDARSSPELSGALTQRDAAVKLRTVGPFPGGDRDRAATDANATIRGLPAPDTRIDAALRSGLGSMFAERSRLQTERATVAARPDSPEKTSELARIDGEISAINTRITDTRARLTTLRAGAAPNPTLETGATSARTRYATAVDALGTLRRDIDADFAPSEEPGSSGPRTFGVPPTTRTFANEREEIAAYDAARADILRDFHAYSSEPMGDSVMPPGSEPPYVSRGATTAYAAIPDNPRPARPPAVLPDAPTGTTPRDNLIRTWLTAERELATLESATPRNETAITAARSRAVAANAAIPDEPRPPRSPLPSPLPTGDSPRATAIRAWAAAEGVDHATAFVSDYGNWELRAATPPDTGGSRYVMIGTPTNAPPTPRPSTWPEMTPPLTIDEVNNPQSISDPTRRSAVTDYRSQVATARMQLLNEQTAARVEDIGHRRNDHWPPEISRSYATAVEERNSALAALGGRPPGATEPESTTDPTRAAAVRRYQAATQRAEEISLQGNAASYRPPRDATAAIAALRTLRQREAEARTATAAADAFDTAHPEPRNATDRAESQRLRGLATTANGRVTEARTAFTTAARDVSQPYNSRGTPTNPTAPQMNAPQPDLPGRTWWEWAKMIMGFVSPAAAIAAAIDEPFEKAGKAINAAGHAAQEIYDEYFDRAHAELKNIRKKTQVDWMQKMATMKALVEAHVKAGGTPGG